MHLKSSTIFLIILSIAFASEIIFPQQSQYNRAKSSGNKKIYKQYQSDKSTLGKPANVTNHKRKDFTINRKENITKNTRYNDKNYSVRKKKSKITRSENYFHVDKSGNTLWDGKHWDLDEYPKVYVKETSSKYYKSDYKDYVNYCIHDAGVLFLTGTGWPPYSGHGLIAVATLAVERGLVTAGRETPSRLVLDTLAGPIPVRLDVGRAAEAASGGAAPRVSRVSWESAPARVLAGGLPLAVAGRTVLADLVSCAGLFAIVDSESAGVALRADTLPELRRAAVPISGVLEARARKVPKDVAAPCGVNVVFIGPSSAGSSDLRSATVAPGGKNGLSGTSRSGAPSSR